MGRFSLFKEGKQMLDLNLIRKNSKFVHDALLKKGWDVDFSELLANDERRRELLTNVEANKAEQNRLSASIPQVKKAGGDITEIFARVKELKALNASGEEEIAELEKKMQKFLEVLPNLPDPDLVDGGKENNVVLQVYNEKPTFDFTPKDHVELCESLGLIDYKRSAKISGSGT